MESVTNLNKVVLPGDVIGSLGDKSFRIGPGLRQLTDNVVATRAGILRYEKDLSYYWLDCYMKRYIPLSDDVVVGIVVERRGDEYFVEIGSAQYGVLNTLAFEGATKKNRPDLKSGALVYCRVESSNRDMNPELVCYSIRNKSDGFGPLMKGMHTVVSLPLARYLLSPKCRLLHEIGSTIAFEIAVGINGRVWICCDEVESTVRIAQCLSKADEFADEQGRLQSVQELLSA